MAVPLRIAPPSAAATSSPGEDEALVEGRMSPVVGLVVCLVVVVVVGRGRTVVIGCVVRTSMPLIRSLVAAVSIVVVVD